jgi:hypothetical protein
MTELAATIKAFLTQAQPVQFRHGSASTSEA